MSKKFLAALLMVTISMGSITVMAEEQESPNNEGIVSIQATDIERAPSSMLSEIGSMSVKENLVVDDISVPLYVTFDSQDQALQNISTNSVIQAIKNEYNYADISNENWNDYYDAMYELLDSDSCPSWYNEENEDFRILRKFFDVYENEEKNIQIASQVTTATTTNDLAQNTDFLHLLPYDSYVTLTQKSNAIAEDQAITRATNLGFNIDKGIAYATKYAKTPNTTDYQKFSADCTNFASQILENGGVSQEKYNDESKGWWHTKSKVAFVTVHKHSISWIRADTFAKYMGVGYNTTSNSSFSNNIKKGDFIAADFENDGDWNHMGFVTDKKTSKTNGYYDYKVAQHTSNYHAWASSSDNGWDTIGSDGGKYGRVRR